MPVRGATMNENGQGRPAGRSCKPISEECTARAAGTIRFTLERLIRSGSRSFCNLSHIAENEFP